MQWKTKLASMAFEVVVTVIAVIAYYIIKNTVGRLYKAIKARRAPQVVEVKP